MGAFSDLYQKISIRRKIRRSVTGVLKSKYIEKIFNFKKGFFFFLIKELGDSHS